MSNVPTPAPADARANQQPRRRLAPAMSDTHGTY